MNVQFFSRLFIIIFFAFIFSSFSHGQELPVGMTEAEEALMPAYLSNISSGGITTPPSGPLRNMAEWEEIQTLLITWRSYYSELSQIVQASQQECEVLINCTDSNAVKTTLLSYGVTPNAHVKFNIVGSNSVWIRDYGPNSVYRYDVDSLILVDWIYNRPRPLDDVMPSSIASYYNLPLYETTTSPYALVHTGGNYFGDGFGTAFSENLILDENQNLTAAQVDTIMKKFMGINRYIKLTNLPYDGIHHIDMHMKLLNEETLLVGKFPTGISDGPQIEANLQYILSNFNSVFGTPYKVLRVTMPPSTSNTYPPSASYRTYSNGMFVNKTYLLPTYYQQYDTTAIRLIEEALPGYNVVPINSNNMISASGAIHCITHSIGVADPLLISSQPYPDTISTLLSYEINARILHRSGIQNASVYYRINNIQSYSSVYMTLTDTLNNIWTGYIPQQQAGDTVKYYIKATSVSNKQQVRPITAPDGYWKFIIKNTTGITNDDIFPHAEMLPVFPNPAKAITCIPVKSNFSLEAELGLYNMLGQKIQHIFNGHILAGKSHYFIDASRIPSGTYFVRFATDQSIEVQKLIIK